MNREEIAHLQSEASTSPDAQYRLAMLYIYGEEIEENHPEAVRLLTLAAEKDHVEAIYNLAICHHYGYGTEIDLAKAYSLYLRSADQGYAKGSHLVGRFYFYGIHVKQNYTEAVKWFRKAYAVRDASSCGFDSCYLGVCHAKGLGVEPNPELSEEYFRTAVSEGGEEARKLIEQLLTE